MLIKFSKFTLSTLLAASLVLVSSTNCLAATTLSRLGGSDRYSTSAIICSEGWNTSSDYAVIASGENFPDALSATPLAKKYNAPMLLTNSSSLSSEVKGRLQALKVKNVFIIGGTGVVYPSVQSEIANMGINVIRLAGQDRFETNLRVAEQLGNFNEVAVVNGYGFPDALSIAPIAAQKGMPILLSNVNEIPDNISNFIKSKNISKSYVIGGTGVLNNTIQQSLPNAERLSGPSRYETNASIINRFSSELDLSQVYIANGENFPDALSGSAIAAKNNSPIVLTNKDSISSEIINFIKNNNVKSSVILGGIGVVSNNVENVVTDTINSMIVHPVSVSLNKTSDILNIGDIEYLTAIISPSNATDKDVSWTTSNPQIATVDNTGKVTALSTGTATITASTVDGNKVVSCSVTVNKQYPITIEQLPIDITIKNPDSIGNVYMGATYKNNSQKNIVGFSATVLLKNTNETTYLSNYDTVLPGETSPNFESFGPETLSKDDIQILEYQITIANDDGTKTYITYDCKLKTYKQN